MSGLVREPGLLLTEGGGHVPGVFSGAGVTLVIVVVVDNFVPDILGVVDDVDDPLSDDGDDLSSILSPKLFFFLVSLVPNLVNPTPLFIVEDDDVDEEEG